VIDEEGEQLGILNVEDARGVAREKGLDLVEVAARSEPPVCKIMDYGRYKYQEKKKTQQAKGNQKGTKLKEVKLRPKTNVHDYQVKLGRAKKFLEEGNKVKVTMMFRGREIYHANVGRDYLMTLANDVSTVGLGVVEVEPRLEGRNMHLILAPKTHS
jgi:translation initiation factor IF-3